MKIINNFNNFLNENSKNDPISEFNENKLAIFVFGVPGSGKTTFIRNKIIPFIKNFKIFSRDGINNFLLNIVPKYLDKYPHLKSLIQLKKPNIPDEEIVKDTISKIENEYNINLDKYSNRFQDLILGKNNNYTSYSSIILKMYLKNYMRGGQNFIYDTTGNDLEQIKEYVEIAKMFDYCIVFINVKSELSKALQRNLERERSVDVIYQFQSYLKSTIYDKYYMDIKPDAFYIIVERGEKYIYYKYEDDVLKKRKVDIYKPITVKNENYETGIDTDYETLTLDGYFYHGTVLRKDEELIEKLETGYSDYDAIWVSSEEDVADDFSDQFGVEEGEIRCIYKIKLDNVENVVKLTYEQTQDIMEEYGLFDFRESIDILKNMGYKGWLTIGTIDEKIYDDYAIFYEDLIYIEEVKFYINEQWTDFMKINDAIEFLKTKIRKNEN